MGINIWQMIGVILFAGLCIGLFLSGLPRETQEEKIEQGVLLGNVEDPAGRDG